MIITTKKNNIPNPNDVSLKNKVKRIGVKIPKVGIPMMFLAKDRKRVPSGMSRMVVNIV
jgi:hypothetical protein